MRIRLKKQARQVIVDVSVFEIAATLNYHGMQTKRSLQRGKPTQAEGRESSR
jgi:hypothetical protein